MADTSDFRNGLVIKFKNDLYSIVEFQHVKPGKGGAFVRTVLKNIRTGKVLDNTFRAGESVEIIRIERRKYQYLYKESAGLVCMDNETFEQLTIDESLFGAGQKFLKESEEVDILFNGDSIVDVEIPIHVRLKVIETEPGFRGDTANNALKPAKVETGAVVNVPLFINVGDLLRIDTRTGEYVERIKN